MTHVTIYRNKENECIGFDCNRTCWSMRKPEKILSAPAISMLVINTCNAIEMLTTDEVFTDDQ